MPGQGGLKARLRRRDGLSAVLFKMVVPFGMRAKLDQHHRGSGKYLPAHAAEYAWREDTRRRANGTLHLIATGAALGHPVSRVWERYWQRTK